MKLNLDTLAFGRSVLDVDETYRLELDEGDAGEVHLQGELAVNNTDSRILVGGQLTAVGATDCDRCLESFELNYTAIVDVVIVRDNYEGRDARSEGSTWTEHQARGVIDLEPALREAALLTVPQKMVCRDDCLGICVHCGANRNEADCDCDQEIVDPRWDGLPS